jgi:hypothetical protein
LIWVNGFRRARPAEKVGRIVLLLFLAAVMAGVFFGTRSLLWFLESAELAAAVPDLPFFIRSVPALVMGTAFLGILLTSFGVLLQALYLSGDMDFLLAAPIPIRAVFLSKLMQAIIPNFGLVCLLALPLLFGLGAAGGYRAAYYPLVVAALAALALAGAGMAALLVMGVVRIFPARRVAEVLGFVGAVVTIICSQSGQFARLSDPSGDQLVQAAAMVTRFDSPWSPLAWAGRGLVGIGEGQLWPGAGMLLATVALSGIVFAVALVAAERLYYTGWASVSVGGARRRPGRGRARAAAKPIERRRRASPVRAIMAKDFILLRRDLRNLSQIITPVIMGLIYTVLLVRSGGEPPPGRGEAPEWFMQAFRDLLVFGDMAIALFVGWMLLGRLAMMGFSQEGRHYWLLKAAPVSAERLLLAKFLVALIPALALGWAFLLVLALGRGVALADAVFTLVAVGLCYAAVAGVNVAFGVAGAVFDWEDPRRMVRGASGCLSTIVSLLVLGLCLVFFVAPTLATAFLELPPALGKIAGLALGGLASAACAVVPLILVRQRVPRLAE